MFNIYNQKSYTYLKKITKVPTAEAMLKPKVSKVEAVRKQVLS